MHQSLTTEILESRLNEDCPQMLIETSPPTATQAAPLPRKQTRAQHIKELLESQPEQPISGQHHLAETTGYLKCVVCGLNIHKRVNEAAFTAFTQSPCVNQAYTADHQGHMSHALWQVGERVKCTQCGTTWNLDGQQRVIATQAFHKPCKGAGTKGSPPLSEYFKKKDSSSSHSPELDTQAPAMTATQPAPRRLSFQTALDVQELCALADQGHADLTQRLAALDMSSSPRPAAEEQAELEVDFF